MARKKRGKTTFIYYIVGYNIPIVYTSLNKLLSRDFILRRIFQFSVNFSLFCSSFFFYQQYLNSALMAWNMYCYKSFLTNLFALNLFYFQLPFIHPLNKSFNIALMMLLSGSKSLTIFITCK